MSDRSGASVAGKETLDLCATSGANGGISCGWKTQNIRAQGEEGLDEMVNSMNNEER